MFATFYLLYECKLSATKESSIYENCRDCLLSRIVYGVLCPTGLAVPHGNHPGGVIHHPLIPPLEATAGVPWADEPHEVSGRQDCLVAFLPALLPPSLEALVRASANQPDSFAGIPEPEHDLGSPDIHATRHTGNKDIESVSNSLADFFFQSSSHHALWACSFSGLYPVNLCANSGFGDKVIDEMAAYIATANPGVKGFNRRGLYRMKQFYETYKDDEFVTPLVTQISWINHLLIMSGSRAGESTL